MWLLSSITFPPVSLVAPQGKNDYLIKLQLLKEGTTIFRLQSIFLMFSLSFSREPNGFFMFLEPRSCSCALQCRVTCGLIWFHLFIFQIDQGLLYLFCLDFWQIRDFFLYKIEILFKINLSVYICKAPF